MKIKTMCFIGTLVTLVGCSTNSLPPKEVSQQSLLVRCPETLPYDYTTDGKGWLLMAEEWSSIYHECKTRHNGLVDFIESE